MFAAYFVPDVGRWHKGNYKDAKMHGAGVMQTSDGWEYIGTWKEDELHGDVVVSFVFGFNVDKQVHVYDMGVKVGQRPYDTSRDWSGIEATGLEAARDGENKALEARDKVRPLLEIPV